MSKLRVNAFTLSLDGYGAGPDQTLQNPLGVGGEDLHKWMTRTRSFHKMVGKDGGTTDVDDRFTVRSFDNVGAWILGRNMFGPIRGDLAGRQLEGLVGRQPALPRAGLRADALQARTDRDGRRHHFPLRHRRHP